MAQRRRLARVGIDFVVIVDGHRLPALRLLPGAAGLSTISESRPCHSAPKTRVAARGEGVAADVFVKGHGSNKQTRMLRSLAKRFSEFRVSQCHFAIADRSNYVTRRFQLPRTLQSLF